MTQDAVEREVRRRVADALAAAGVEGDRVATEVLYMLPPEFVRVYRQLFDMALKWSPRSGSGVTDEAAATRGLSGGGKDRRDPLHARTVRAAQDSGGKRWRQMPWTVKSEAASEAKSRLDRNIVRAAQETLRELRSEPRPDGEENGQARKKKCPTCGRGYASGWVRCPFHE